MKQKPAFIRHHKKKKKQVGYLRYCRVGETVLEMASARGTQYCRLVLHVAQLSLG